IDRIHSMTSRIRIYKLPAQNDGLAQFADVISQSACAVAKAVNALRDTKRMSRIHDYCIEVNRLENIGDTLREAVIVKLFEETPDPILVIKWKEIYELAESTIDECEHVAKAVESILVKHG
ncbi:MAG: DUF47 family protein, partial [Elusimicrobia bacterium]|nr:DUF47 family protein [Elusimicrobiota bacterium]